VHILITIFPRAGTQDLRSRFADRTEPGPVAPFLLGPPGTP